jgi:hypothetical protein
MLAPAQVSRALGLWRRLRAAGWREIPRTLARARRPGEHAGNVAALTTRTRESVLGDAGRQLL